MPSNLPYVAVALGVFLQPWWIGTVIGSGFALGRLMMTTARARNTSWEAQWARWQRVTLVALNVCAVCLLAVVAWTRFRA